MRLIRSSPVITSSLNSSPGTYKEQTMPVIEHYSKEGKVATVRSLDLPTCIVFIGVVQIDGCVIGGRGLNGTPGRAVAKSSVKIGDDAERPLMFTPLGTTGTCRPSCHGSTDAQFRQ